MSFKKYDGGTWQSITPKKVKGMPYTGTLPAVLTGTKAGYLHRYKIYGNTEQAGIPTSENPIVPSECGEKTGNLFDVEEITHNGYSKNNFYNQVSPNNICAVIKRLEPNTNYCITWEFSSTSQEGVYNQMRLYAATTLIGYVNSGTAINFTQEQIDSITNVIVYFGSGNTDGYYKNFTIVEGSTAPTQYIPYGYKLPLTSGSTTVDIYIGDDTLSTDEYVDSGTGKIYRMVGGVLTPVDPPVPFPQILTSAGSTTISWAGEGLEPSEFDSIQEWVDIPTYRYTNGEWVEPKIYGIRIDPDVADPYNRVTYLEDAVGMTPASMGATAFDYGSWENAFFMPKPCVLNYNGTVAYYLDPNDYSKKIDGTPSNIDDLSIGGNVMLEFPKIWFKYVPNAGGNDGDFYVANYKADESYECWCNYDADNNEIDYFYMAAYNGCCYDGKMRSISGLTLAPYVTTAYSASATYAVGDKVNYNNCMYKCITAVETAEAFDPAKWEQYAYNGNTSGTEEIARARANNTTAKDEWMIDLWADAILIWGLLYLISKSTDVQATFGRGIDSGSQAVAEAYVTGSLNDKGLFYGSTANGSTAVKVFGIENFWACKWRRCAGLFGTSTGYAYKLTHGTKDGSTASSFGTSAAGYLTVTAEQPANNYVKNMMLGRHGLIAGVTGSPASVSTYYCDYFYRGTGFAFFGGASNGGKDCGVYVYLYAGVSARGWIVAAAPSCKPLHN